MFDKLLSLGITAGIFLPNVVLAEQIIIQQVSVNDPTFGNHNYAGVSVHQSSTQNRHANPNGDIQCKRIG